MRLIHVIAGVAISAALSWAAIAIAQEDASEEQSAVDSPDVASDEDSDLPTEIPPELLQSPYMDEITVIVGPQGQSLYELRMEEQERVRESIYADMRLRQRGEQEIAWRQEDIDLENPESRIKWGYSPQSEQRMRRSDSFMFDRLPGDTMPASVFRVEF